MSIKMTMDRAKNAIRNVIAGFYFRFVHMLMPFIIRSVIIKVLGEEYLGLNTLFSSIFTFLNLAEFGFASALTFKMYEPVKNQNYHILSVYASAIKRVYKIVGIIILSLGILILPFLPKFINGNCPSDVNIYVLYMIYLANTIIPYLSTGYCTSIFTAFQRMDISNIINANITLALNLIQILILLFTRAYYPYILCLPLFTILNNTVLYYFKNKQYREINTNYKIDKSILRETYSSAGALFGHSLNYVIVSAADNIVISSFLGLSVLAMYGNYYTILSAVLGLIDIVIQSCMPSIGNLLLDHDEEHEFFIFKAISFLSYWISGWCAVCLLCLYQPFMNIWMGSNMLLPFSTVILFAMYLYSYKARATIILFENAAGMWKADFLKPYVSAIANTILNILLVKMVGLNGVLISTIIAFIVISFPWESNVLLNSRYPSYKNHFYREFIIYVVMNLFLSIVTYNSCILITSNNNFFILILRGLICLLLPNILWMIINRNKPEYQYIKKKILNIKKKK